MKSLTLLLLLCACGDEAPLRFEEFSFEDYRPVINQQQMPGAPHLQSGRHLTTPTYPIEIVMFSDGQFYYDLTNYGDGTGTWEYQEGLIHLTAKRKLFDMKMTMVKVKDHPEGEVALKFVDRRGEQYHVLRLDQGSGDL